MDNIEDILRALVGDSDSESEENAAESGGCSDGGEGGGLFDGLDMETLMKIMSVLGNINKHDDNERFLLALKPLLREENRPKIDSALKFLKISALFPLLRDSGILGKLF